MNHILNLFTNRYLLAVMGFLFVWSFVRGIRR
jgi:hypothetical protein